LKRIEPDPHSRRYTRLILHVDDLSILLGIANSIEGTKLQINDYEITTDADIATLLAQGRCIRNLDFRSVDFSKPTTLYCHIRPWAAYLERSYRGDERDFLRVDQLLRDRVALYSMNIVGGTSVALLILLGVAVLISTWSAVASAWSSFSSAGPAVAHLYLRLIYLIYLVCMLGLVGNIFRKQNCLKIRGRVLAHDWLNGGLILVR
jgi:hypothetical protein